MLLVRIQDSNTKILEGNDEHLDPPQSAAICNTKRRRVEASDTDESDVAPQRSDLPEEADSNLPSMLSPDDPEHFCRLSMAIWIWNRRSIAERDIDMGQTFMESYLGSLTSVCYHFN